MSEQNNQHPVLIKNQHLLVDEGTLLDPQKIWDTLTTSPRSSLKKFYKTEPIEETIHGIADVIGYHNEQVKYMQKGIAFMKKIENYENSHIKQSQNSEQVKKEVPIQEKTPVQELNDQKAISEYEQEQAFLKEKEMLEAMKPESILNPQGSPIVEQPTMKAPIETDIATPEKEMVKEVSPLPVSEEAQEAPTVSEPIIQDMVDEYPKSVEAEIVEDEQEAPIVENVIDEKDREHAVIIDDTLGIKVEPTKSKPNVEKIVEPFSPKPTAAQKIFEPTFKDVKEPKKAEDTVIIKDDIEDEDVPKVDSKFKSGFKSVKEPVSEKAEEKAHKKSGKFNKKAKQTNQNKKSDGFKEVSARKTDEDFPLVKTSKDGKNQGSMILFMMMLQEQNGKTKQEGDK